MTELILDGLILPTDVDVDLGELSSPADLPAALQRYLEGMRDLVRSESRLWTAGNRYPIYEALVLDQGRPMRAARLPAGVARGRLRYCYGNALSLVHRHQGLTYVEGFAIAWHDGRPGAPSLHAWAINANGRVWDPTWPEPESSAYWGLAFSRADVDRFVALDADTFGILATEHLIGSPLLRTGRLFPEGASR